MSTNKAYKCFHCGGFGLTKNIRPRGEDIRAYILRNADKDGLAQKVAEHFSITRQAAGRHLQKLTDEKALVAVGNTRNRTYKLAATATKTFFYEIKEGLAEDVVWQNDIRPFLGDLPETVLEMWQWSFTEMFNNAIDHSGGSYIFVRVSKTAINTEISVADDGVGIFVKIQKALNLMDERHAILELSKGKLTTDSRHHSGWGIFFTSRMVDNFDILSGGVYFSHVIGEEHDWILERSDADSGTAVYLKIDNHTSRTRKKTLDKFSVGDSYGFDKTVVPVRLAKYGTDQLISRSQAKRVLARIELFTQVLFDFTNVEMVGQAFADQIFRVFQNEHPEMQLFPTHANAEIRAVINEVRRQDRQRNGESAMLDAIESV